METNLNGSELEQHIANRLNHFSNWYVHSRGYRFGEGADTQLIPDFTQEAASKITATELPAPLLEVTIKDAEKKMKAFVNKMIEVRRDVYKNDPDNLRKNVIGELTFAEAKGFFCPLWPFCE